jgi:integrase/recombinase XerD
VAYAGLKFFYRHTCPRDWPTLTKLRVPKQFKLPTVLTIPEVDQLIDAIRKPALKCFFWTVYSLGLRLEEALHLQVSDIDAGRMLVHVRRGKGHKDRLIPLTPKTLDLLRAHWRTHRHPHWLFPAEGRNHRQAATAERPVAKKTVQDCIAKVVDELGWAKRGISTHTLRHLTSGFQRVRSNRRRFNTGLGGSGQVNKHPNKHIRAAVDYALANGWTLRQGGASAHIWGRLRCTQRL